MSETYDAIYAAVRSRLSNCDVGQAIRDACHLDGSFAKQVKQAFVEVAGAVLQYQTQPSVLYHPDVGRRSAGGWYAQYRGVRGEGRTPEEAVTEFNRIWKEGL